MDPVLPDYQGACVTNIVPTLLAGPAAAQEWFPDEVLASRQVVLLVLDGLGWHQLASRPEIAPVLSGLAGSHITTIAPSTTATGLTSITTGLPPGEHGMVGYRVRTHGTVLSLRFCVSKSAFTPAR